MIRPLALALAFLAAPLGAGGPDLDKLPAWAQAPAREASAQAPPPEAGAWVLFQREEWTYQGSGTVRARSLRLVQVLRGEGLQEAWRTVPGLREGDRRLRTLKGWNLRPDGKLFKLERRNKATLGGMSEAAFDTSRTEVAYLPNVTAGSLVAFELEVEVPGQRDPCFTVRPLESIPVRRWEFEASCSDSAFSSLNEVRVEVSRRRFEPWITRFEASPGGAIRAQDLPALPAGETANPWPDKSLPEVQARFRDPRWPGAAIMSSWKAMGAWYHDAFVPKVGPAAPGGPAAGTGLPALRALWAWWGRSMTYKQVYLSPERDWMPEPAAEVARKRYGDCKDLSCLFLSLAQNAGFQGMPVLARIEADPITQADASGPPADRFNHVVAALRLEGSLGLPAEVETPMGRFLLVDPTDPSTPLGWLNDVHRGGWVLVCLPDGGQWARIPDAAILRGGMEIALQARASEKGRLEGELDLRETGDAWGLRSHAGSMTPADFRRHLASRFLDQAINGEVEILAQGDPRDLERPFQVRLRFVHPTGWRRQGSGCALDLPLGLPGVPPPLTRPGKPRRLPIEFRSGPRLAFHGCVNLPAPVQSLDARRQASTAFRDLSWNLATRPSAEGGCLLEFTVDQEEKDAWFGLDQLPGGVAAWKADRALVKALREDAFAFR